MTDLVAVDVDGTLKVGAPPGPIFTETLEGLAANGAIVVIVSPSPAAQGLWDRFDMVTADGLER
jgi:ribonucleotide monophosphatase NagD (HAD superfamily)